jgi:hypothetical protein
VTHDHTVTVEWDRQGWAGYTFTCHAPAFALCHAVYDCDCEGWTDDGITDGIPWHLVDDGDEEHRHTGALDPQQCGLRDWFENSDEALRGRVTFPVTPDWRGDHVLFDAIDEYPRPQTETLPIEAAHTTTKEHSA